MQSALGDFSPWALYVNSLICDYGISPGDAWEFTVGEYFDLYKYKANANTMAKASRTIDRVEADELKAKLRAMGKDV